MKRIIILITCKDKSNDRLVTLQSKLQYSRYTASSILTSLVYYNI